MASTTAGAQQADWRSTLGRAGLGARGILYLIIGYLALQAAFGSGSGQQASSGGVFSYLKGQNEAMLWVLALGLLAYTLWMFTRAFFGDPVTGSETTDKVVYGVKAVLYTAVTFSAFRALLSSSGGGGGGGGGGNQQAAGLLLGLPGGAFIVGIIGLIGIGYGVKQFKENGLDAEFMQKLSPDRYANESAVKRAGQAGYMARGVTIAMIGGFFIIAAIQHDPDEAKGLGGALSTLSQQSYGPWLLALAGLGLGLFGAYCIAEAKMRRDHD